MIVVNQHALAETIPESVQQLCRTLKQAGHGVWCVGGAIRDAIATQLDPNKCVLASDWDIASSATPEEVIGLFRRVVPSGIKHGTVTVLFRDCTVEVTTLRGEQGYSDGRHPDNVVFVNDIREDLARRDFTINAIAFDPIAKALIDPFDGVADLAQNCLRAVGDPRQRFAEDGLRVLRAARFAATLETAIEPATRNAMAPSLDSYRKVSAERIRDEWMKSLKARAPSRAFEIMLEQGLLDVTAPELARMHECAQNRHHLYDVWKHTMVMLDQVDRTSLALRLAALFHDVGKPPTRAIHPATGEFTFHDHELQGAQITDDIMRRLKFPNEVRERVVTLVRHHLVVYTPSWTDAAVRRWLNRVTPELSDSVLQLARADVMAKGLDAEAQLTDLKALQCRAKQIIEANQAITLKALAISGHQLIEALGIAPGPLVGRMLRSLFDEVLEAPERNERERLLDRARELLKSFTNPAVDQTSATRGS